MAATYLTTVAAEQLLVMIETSPGSGTYAAPATINLQRNLEMMSQADANLIYRTDNPSAPAQTQRTVVAIDWKCGGQGTMQLGDDVVYANWWASGASKNVQITNTLTGAIVLTGPAVLTSFALSGDGIGKKVQATIQLEGAGLPSIATHA